MGRCSPVNLFCAKFLGTSINVFEANRLLKVTFTSVMPVLHAYSGMVVHAFIQPVSVTSMAVGGLAAESPPDEGKLT